MTTTKFSATDLPHPRYSLEVGRFSIRSKEQRQQKQSRGDGASTGSVGDLYSCGGNDRGAAASGDDDDVNLPSTCLPRFSQLAQVVEVRMPGCTLPGRVSSNIKDFLGSYCVIENARPELFIRRDFISKFVDKGTIHISQLSDCHAPAGDMSQSSANYKIGTSKNNVMTITMNSKQYHRFGMTATRVISSSVSGARKRTKRQRAKRGGADDIYRVEISLGDERIKKSNAFQDKLMSNLKRLNPINKVYFRFIPDKSKLDLSIAAANQLSMEFFNFVINEYAQDGCKPLPLTKCHIVGQRIEQSWVNYSQLHPNLGTNTTLAALGPLLSRCKGLAGGDLCIDNERSEKTEIALADLVRVVDWVGYQLLRLDCDKMDEIERWDCPNDERVDVSCTQIIGNIDSKQVREKLNTLFSVERGDGMLLRVLILYDGQCNDFTELCLINGASPKRESGSEHLNRISNNNNSGVVYLQDCTNGSEAARDITVIGMSNLPS